MTRATRRVEHTGPTAQFLYLAFELGVEEWKLGFTTQCLAGPADGPDRARDASRRRR